MPRYIQYGDLVYIEISESLLCSNGFESPNVYLVAGLNLKSYRHCLFQFCPLLEDQDPHNNEPKVRKNNLKKLKEAQGKPVQLSERFLLLHAESKMFVQINYSVHNITEPFVKTLEPSTPFTLSHEITKASHFKVINTGHQEQAHGNEKLEYDASVQIVSCESGKELQKGAFIVKKPVLNPHHNTLTNSTNDFPMIAARRKEPVWDMSAVYQVGLNQSTKPQSSYFRLFCAKNFLEHVRNTGLIVNGDYIRLSQGNYYLSYFQSPKEKLLYFQSHRSKEYAYNFSATSWQLIQVPNLPSIPQGQVTWTNTFDQEIDPEVKKYVLRHFVTGEYLVISDGQVTCKPLAAISDSTSFAEIFRKEYKPLTSGSAITLRLKEHNLGLYLSRMEPVPVKVSQFEVNTVYFFGFKWTEDYLHKIVNVERYKIKALPNHEGPLCNLRVDVLSADEILHLQEAESLVNSLQAFLDFLFELPANQPDMLARLHQEIDCLSNILQNYHRKIYTVHETATDIVTTKTPCFIKQSMLRELKFFDLANRIFYNFVRSPFVQNKIAEHLKTADEEAAFDQQAVLHLFEVITGLILAACENNRLNTFYQSQFIRVDIHCLLNSQVAGVLKDCPGILRSHNCFKKLLLAFLWDQDLDGIGQLNYYKDNLYASLIGEETYGTAFLEVLTHFTSSKALNLKNQLREQFLSNNVSEEAHMAHIFPSLVLDGEVLYVVFKRLKRQEADVNIPLTSLTHTGDEDSYIDDDINEKYRYLEHALKFFISLTSPDDYRFYLFAMRKYPLNLVQIALQTTQDLKFQHLFSEIMTVIYSRYFAYLKQAQPKEIDTPYEIKRGEMQIWNEEKALLSVSNVEIEPLVKLGLEKDTALLKNWDYFVKTHPLKDHSQFFLNFVQKILYWRPNDVEYMLRPAYKGLLYLINRYFDKDYAQTSFKILSQSLALKEKLELAIAKVAAFDIYNSIRNTGISGTALNPETARATFLSKIETWKTHERLEELTNIDESLPYTTPAQFVQNSLEFILKQQDSAITRILIVHLTGQCEFENNVKKELASFVPIRDPKSIEAIERVLSVSDRLNECKRIMQLKRDLVSLQGKDIYDQCFNTILLSLETLVVTIYDTKAHLREHSESTDITDAKFVRNFQQEKVQTWDKVLKINERAIIKPMQKVLRHVQLYDTILELIGIFLKLKTGWAPDIMLVYAKIIRLCFFILTVFVYRNPENQLLLASHRSFILNYYDQNYINQGADCMVLFAEVMRENSYLLSLPHKFLFDISWYTFIGTLKRQINSTETNAYLCACLMSLHFLIKLEMPASFIDSVLIFTEKMHQVTDGDFSNMHYKNLLINEVASAEESNERHITSPFCYYTIREFLLSLVELLPFFAKDDYIFKKLQRSVPSDKWAKALSKPHYMMHFEIRNAATRAIHGLHFSRKQIEGYKFINSKDAYANLISVLITDLAAYLEFRKRDDLKFQTMNSNIIGELETSYASEQLKADWNQLLDFLSLPIGHIRQRVHVEDIPLRVLWTDYVHEGLLELTSALIENYPEYASENSLSSNGDIKSFADLYLYYLQFLFEDTEREISPRASSLLQKLAGNAGLAEWSSRFHELANKNYTHIKSTKKLTLAEDFEENILQQVGKGENYRDKNVEALAKTIIHHEKGDQLIDEVIRGVKDEHWRMNFGELKFVGQMLKKYGQFGLGLSEEEKIIDPLEQAAKVGKLTSKKKYTELVRIFSHGKDTKATIKGLLAANELFGPDVNEVDIWNDEQAKSEDD